MRAKYYTLCQQRPAELLTTQCRQPNLIFIYIIHKNIWSVGTIRTTVLLLFLLLRTVGLFQRHRFYYARSWSKWYEGNGNWRPAMYVPFLLFWVIIFYLIIIILVGLAVEHGRSHLSLASYNIAFLNSLLRGSRSHLDPNFGLKSEFINWWPLDHNNLKSSITLLEHRKK